MVAADESAAYATVYTNFGDSSSVHRVDLRSGEDDEVLGDVRYYFSTRPLVSPDLSVVATLDDDYVSELIQLPGGGTRLDSGAASPCARSTGAAEWLRSTQSCCATSAAGAGRHEPDRRPRDR